MSWSKEWPRVDELVVAVVTRIVSYGAYVSLEEYGGKEGLIPITEISSAWVRNIRDFVREGQRVVLKVLRVNPRKRLIDLSLRRVSGPERRRKMLAWKRKSRAKTIIEIVAKELGLGEEKAKIIDLIEDNYGSLYEGLKATAEDGVRILLAIGVPKKIAEKIAEVAMQRIRLPIVKLKGILSLSCSKPAGVEIIREALMEAKQVARPGIEINIYTIGAPRYRIEVISKDPKLAEEVLKRASEIAVKRVVKMGGRGSFQRI